MHINTIFSSLNYREFKFAHTVIFAVEEINRNPSILPRHRVGYRIYNACGYSNIMRSAMALASGVEKVIDGRNCSHSVKAEAIIGHSASAPTMGFARILGRFQVPVVILFSCIHSKGQNIYCLNLHFIVNLHYKYCIYVKQNTVN